MKKHGGREQGRKTTTSSPLFPLPPIDYAVNLHINLVANISKNNDYIT